MALRRTGLASRRRSRLGPALSRPLRARPRESCTTSPLEPVSKQRERRLFAYRLLWRAHTINLQPLFIYSALDPRYIPSAQPWQAMVPGPISLTRSSRTSPARPRRPWASHS
jgi:hypothetical protein